MLVIDLYYKFLFSKEILNLVYRECRENIKFIIYKYFFLFIEERGYIITGWGF